MGHFGCYINYDFGAFLEVVRHRWRTGNIGLYLCVLIAVALAGRSNFFFVFRTFAMDIMS